MDESIMPSAISNAKQSGADPFAATESVLPWDAFIESVTEAQKFRQSRRFDYLSYISDGHSPTRRVHPELLDGRVGA